jgi:hypothetical protein
MESVLENKLMTLYKDEMISYLKMHPNYFDEAVQLAISDKQPYSWRAAFLLWGSIEENDNRIKKYVKTIISCLPEKKDGHQRELLKILYKMKINANHEGQIYNICINLWGQKNKTPSVRMTAFKYIVRIVKLHPELMDEIVFLTQDHYLESLSPGVKSSIKRMMQELMQ